MFETDHKGQIVNAPKPRTSDVSDMVHRIKAEERRLTRSGVPVVKAAQGG